MMLYQSPAGPAYDCPSPWYWIPETPIGPPSVSITSVPSSTYRNDGARLRCFPVWPPGANSTTWPERAAGTDSATLAIAPVEPTRPRLLTPFGCADFASCACAGAMPGIWPFCAWAPHARTNSPTATATVPLSLIDVLHKCRMRSPHSSLDRRPGDARDELVQEEIVDDRDRHPDEQRAGHERAPEVHVAPDQLRRHAERHRFLLGDGHEGERVQEVLHGQREREDHGRDHTRPAYRQHHTQQRAELAAPVDHRRLLDLERHRLEEPHEEPGAERDREGRIHHDQRPPGVLEVELAHDPRERDEQDDRRHEVRHEDGDPQVLGERQPEPRERVARGHGRQQRDRRDEERDTQRVDQPVAVERPLE